MQVDISESTYENNPKEEQYFIAKNKSRDIRLPQRYVDLIAYILSVVEETDGVGDLLHI